MCEHRGFDDAYTSESLVATSLTRSLTTGVIGVNDGVLVMEPAAEGPLPFVPGTVICSPQSVAG